LPGTYAVTSTDANGCVSSYSIFVSQPCVDATTYSIPLNGGPVIINAASSGVAPLSYSWTLNGLPMSTTQSSVTTTINGTYCYTITDATGCIVSNCYTYTSSPTGSCTAFFTTAFDSLYLPSSNNMLVDFTSYPNGLPPFTYNWVFSDGSTSNLANPQHVFYYSNVADLMWAWASLTITDATGCTATYNNSVPMPPSYYGCNAFFTSSSYYNASNTGLVQFTNLSATQDTGATYFWTFGDSSYSYSQNPSHVFQASGVYYVCLTITNSYGCSASYCESIYIDLNWWNGNPYNTGCTAGYVLVPNYAAPGTVLIVDVSQVNNASYMWNTSNGFMTNAPNPFFNLTGPGTFTLCATVTDTLTGCSDTFCDSLSIDSLGNVFKTGSNTFISANATVSFVVVSAPKNAQATGITENKEVSAVLLYPNPANNSIEISNWYSNETSTLSMYDVAGSLVLEKKWNANSTTNKTDISGLSNGSYVVKLSDSKHSSLSKLLIHH
jgi:PKD repeat protein